MNDVFITIELGCSKCEKKLNVCDEEQIKICLRGSKCSKCGHYIHYSSESNAIINDSFTKSLRCCDACNATWPIWK